MSICLTPTTVEYVLSIMKQLLLWRCAHCLPVPLVSVPILQLSSGSFFCSIIIVDWYHTLIFESCDFFSTLFHPYNSPGQYGEVCSSTCLQAHTNHVVGKIVNEEFRISTGKWIEGGKVICCNTTYAIWVEGGKVICCNTTYAIWVEGGKVICCILHMQSK